jgi:hypothetical protein
MAFPAVKYSINPCPQPFVTSAWMPKFKVSAAAGWVVVSVVVLPAWPVIDPEARAGLVRPPWCQNQEPEQSVVVHVRVRVTFPPAVFAWAGTTAGADTQAAMRIPKARIPSLTGGKRRDMARLIGRSSSPSVVRHGVTRPV